MATQRQERLRQLPALRPADGTIVSGYGMRMHPTLGVRKMHAGVDILLEIGSPVVAPGDGVVKRTGRSSTYGRYVEVEHKAAGYTTRYAHLSEIPYRIRRGRTVARGDTIAFSGNSGRSTGPHLHYEVMDEKGRTINPIRFFAPDMTPSEYQKLLAKSERLNASID
jgi:murein DD-endopeptidase MepM/ murein hydrolase activator NlpD